MGEGGSQIQVLLNSFRYLFAHVSQSYNKKSHLQNSLPTGNTTCITVQSLENHPWQESADADADSAAAGVL